MFNEYNKLMEDCSMCNDQCVYGCPAFTINRTTTVYPGRKVYLAYSLARNEIDCTESLAKSLYQCCSCGLCKTYCVYGIKGDPRDPIPLFHKARYEIIKRGIKLDYVKDAEVRINKYGNLYGDVSIALSELKDSNIKGEEVGIIYLVDAESLMINSEASKAAITLMNKKNIKPIISDRFESGYDLKANGFLEEAISMAKKMAEYLNKSSANKLVIASPKTYYAIKEWYKELGIKIKQEVILEIDFFYGLFIVPCDEYKSRPYDLQNFIKTDKLVAYHDGSFMARYLKNYDAPRMIIKSLFTQYQELRTNKEKARPLASAVYPLGISEDFLKKLAERRIIEIKDANVDYVITSDAQSYAALKKYWNKEKVLSISEALLMNYVEMEK